MSVLLTGSILVMKAPFKSLPRQGLVGREGLMSRLVGGTAVRYWIIIRDAIDMRNLGTS